MKHYVVEVSPKAERDIENYINYIMWRCNMPITASRHKEHLYARIASIAIYPESIKISDKKDVLRYGANARAVRYKKMLIVYTVHDTLVVIETVMPASMVVE